MSTPTIPAGERPVTPAALAEQRHMLRDHDETELVWSAFAVQHGAEIAADLAAAGNANGGPGRAPEAVTT